MASRGIDDFGRPVGYFIPDLKWHESRLEERDRLFYACNRLMKELKEVLVSEKVPIREVPLVYPRDYLFWMKDKPSVMEDLNENNRWSFRQAMLKTHYWGCHSGILPQIKIGVILEDLFERHSINQFSATHLKNSQADLREESPNILKFPMKGGNFFQIGGKGFISSLQFATLHEYLRMRGYFEQIRDLVQTLMPKQLSSDEFNEAARKLYYLSTPRIKEAEFSQKGSYEAMFQACELNQSDPSKTPLAHFQTIEKVANAVLFENAQLGVDWENEVYRFVAEEKAMAVYLARKFGFERDQLYQVPPMAYHLDLILAPGPNQSVFISSHIESVKLLEQIDDSGFSENEKKWLEQMKMNELEMDQKFSDRTNEIADVFVRAGFHPILAPGSFYRFENKDEEGATIHFLNCVTGQSFQDGTPYLITAGLEMGEQLGKAIMAGFKAFMCEHLPKGSRVYFIGKDEEGRFSSGLDLFSKEGPSAGAHCLSSPFPIQEALEEKQSESNLKGSK